jgi:uroporphyrinogen decarboxylase
MNSKERVLVAFAHQEPDRVPINYMANPGIDARLKQHFGLDEHDDEGLRQALGVDFRSVSVPYIGPRLHDDVPDRQIDRWGIHRRWIEHDTGGYWDYCDFPLENASLDEIEAWPMPDPDQFDYSHLAEQCEQWKDYCIVAGGAGLGDIINSAGMIRTMSQVLIDLITDNPAGLRYIDRKLNTQIETTRRMLETARGGIDLLWLGEDLGTQIGPMISIELFRKHIRPRHQKLVDLGKEFGIPVAIHSCGSSSWAFEDFIDMGIDVVDTLQPEAKDMAPAQLKTRFGGRLAFHGCISTAGPVATGTVQETIDTVRETLKTMMPGGGYAFSPTHMLQDNSPTENVVAMYEKAHELGRYSG